MDFDVWTTLLRKALQVQFPVTPHFLHIHNEMHIIDVLSVQQHDTL